MAIANIAPANTPDFKSNDRHKCLYRFLVMQPFSAADFKRELKLFPRDNQFFNSLCYVGLYRNTGITDFSAWLKNCTDAVNAVADACGKSFHGDTERSLYTWGLAARTFVFDDTCSQFIIDEDLLNAFVDFGTNTDEALWAMYQIGAVALDKMEYTPREGRSLPLFTRLLMKTLQIKSDFESMKTVHYDTEKGIINYG